MKGFKKLKEMWDENPLTVIAVMGATFVAASKLVDSITAIQSKRAYATQIRNKNKSK